MQSSSSQRNLPCDWILITVFLINFLVILGVSNVQLRAKRSGDSSNLRSIIQSCLLYANDHNDQFPLARDIWDYAKVLAESSDLNNAYMWQGISDPATVRLGQPITILNPDPAHQHGIVNTVFLQIKPSYAVVLEGLDGKMPPATPIMWTRGLQKNGTWSKTSPYRSEGGLIAFLGGNIHFFNDLNADGGQLVRFDGKGKTANIFEALPPDSRIGEYNPTHEDEAAWWRIRLWRRYSGADNSGIPFLWTPLFLCMLYRLIRKKWEIGKVSTTLGIIACLQVILMWITCR